MNVLLAAAAATLFAIGTFLVIQRKLSRIIIGIGLLSHGTNILFIMSGRRGTAPLIGNGPASGYADPLPQAMALTAIVISFASTAFLLALAYRSWILTDDDEVEDDVTDRLVARGGFADEEVEDASDEGEDSSDFPEIDGSPVAEGTPEGDLEHLADTGQERGAP